MRKSIKGKAAFCVIVLFFILLAVLIYIALAGYYRHGFAMNTWINGVYCTGSTVQEVNTVLLEQTETPEDFVLIGYDKEGGEGKETSWIISMDEINLQLDYKAGLESYFKEQDSFRWLDNIAFHREHTLEAEVSFDEETLESLWSNIADSVYSEQEYRIEYTEETGYVLYDGLHKRLDRDKGYAMLKEALSSGERSVNLIEKECYYDMESTAEQRELALLWESIEAFQGKGPIYDFGDGEARITCADMCGFILKDELYGMPVTDENGHFVLAEESIEQWISKMADIHDTYGREWEFASTRGDTVKVKGVTYGTKINRKRENLWLSLYLEKLAAGEPEDTETIRIPEYVYDAYNRSCAGIGDTYIEVDMGIQKLYYYKDGKLEIETDVVSGNARRRMNTPEGVNYVYNKQKNRILRGEGYATPVKFWMPVKGAIGIHDADWRSEFGGDIYKTDGSHGCINVPPEVMTELYEIVEIGTPVVMFYGEET